MISHTIEMISVSLPLLLIIEHWWLKIKNVDNDYNDNDDDDDNNGTDNYYTDGYTVDNKEETAISDLDDCGVDGVFMSYLLLLLLIMTTVADDDDVVYVVIF